MLHFQESYFAPHTFLAAARDSGDLECVEMDSELPFYAASVQMADGNIRWLILSGPSALARAQEGLAEGDTAIAVYQLKPDFESGTQLHLQPVLEWDALVRIVTEEKAPIDTYRITGKVLIPAEQ